MYHATISSKISIINDYHIYDDYSAQVQNKMIEFDKNGVPQWDFNGKALLKGELSYVTPILMIILRQYR